MKCDGFGVRAKMEKQIGRPLQEREVVHVLEDGSLQLMRTPKMHLIHHSRTPREEDFMQLAERMARRTNCGRAAHGAVATNEDMTRVEGIGYNGIGKGLPHSLCKAWIQGGCGCLHAEENCLVKAGPGRKLLFVTGEPCERCANLIINSEVVKVFIRGSHYRPVEGVDRLEMAGIPVVRLE